MVFLSISMTIFVFFSDNGRLVSLEDKLNTCAYSTLIWIYKWYIASLTYNYYYYYYISGICMYTYRSKSGFDLILSQRSFSFWIIQHHEWMIISSDHQHSSTKELVGSTECCYTLMVCCNPVDIIHWTADKIFTLWIYTTTDVLVW